MDIMAMANNPFSDFSALKSLKKELEKQEDPKNSAKPANEPRKKTVTLYGSSCDFGSADFRHLKLMDREFKDYTFIFTPIADLPGNVLDLSDVEWI